MLQEFYNRRRVRRSPNWVIILYTLFVVMVIVAIFNRHH